MEYTLSFHLASCQKVANNLALPADIAAAAIWFQRMSTLFRMPSFGVSYSIRSVVPGSDGTLAAALFPMVCRFSLSRGNA
jgi:hypothetical protein